MSVWSYGQAGATMSSRGWESGNAKTGSPQLIIPAKRRWLSKTHEEVTLVISSHECAPVRTRPTISQQKTPGQSCKLHAGIRG